MFAFSRFIRPLGLLAAILVLSACGGGSSGGGSSDETYTVSATSGIGGSISPNSQTVEQGASATFTVTPETGYSIDSVSGCGGSLDGNTYTTGTISGACTVEASFLLNTYTVSTAAGAGGSINPASLVVAHGATATFSVTPETGYSIDSANGCGGSLDGNTYTTGTISGACTVSVSFSFLPSVPENLQGTAADREVLLQWVHVPGADSYNIYHATEGGIRPANFGIWMSQYDGVIIENVISPHTVKGLNNGTEYFFVVTATDGGQESEPSNEVSAVPQAMLTVTGELNDTGIDWCADGSNGNLTCPVAGYPSQDGEFGRDAATRAGTLQKVGAGAAGFDYTKIANNGTELPASATLGSDPTDWACTRDNVAGLIWEVKTTNGGLRDWNHTYSWYQPDGPNMGNPGTQDGGSCVGSACDTTSFMQAVNAQGLCGATDWRLPTVGELHSIVHHGRTNPAVDTGFFPNTIFPLYWSASPYAGRSDAAWYVSHHSDGASDWLSTSLSYRVRLVRGEQ